MVLLLGSFCRKNHFHSEQALHENPNSAGYRQHNWKPKSEEETEVVSKVLGKLAAEGKGYAVQKRHRLFELSLVLCARYIDSAMRLRNASFWESCALQKSKEPVGTSQPQSQSRISAVGVSRVGLGSF